jgi:hypothetical protein
MTSSNFHRSLLDAGGAAPLFDAGCSTSSGAPNGHLTYTTGSIRALYPMQQPRLRIIAAVAAELNPRAPSGVGHRPAAIHSPTIIRRPSPGVQVLANPSRQPEMTRRMGVTKHAKRDSVRSRRQHPMNRRGNLGRGVTE